MKKKYLVMLGSCMLAAAVFSGCKTRSIDLKTAQEKVQEGEEENIADLDDHAGIVKDNVVAGTEITADHIYSLKSSIGASKSSAIQPFP